MTILLMHLQIIIPAVVICLLGAGVMWRASR
jgi:hypothetical protein